MSWENMQCSRYSGIHDLSSRAAKKKKRNTLLKSYTVEALVSGHTRDKKEVSVTRAGGLQK